MAQSTPNCRLLNLPQEIKDQIWEYAFGHRHLPLYTATKSDGGYRTYNDCADCEACEGKTPLSHEFEAVEVDNHRGNEGGNGDDVPLPQRRIAQPFYAYNRELNRLFTCKALFSEAAVVFTSTVTLHIRSPEAIALTRQSAPSTLRHTLKKLVVYIHFDASNHFLWCMRLLELAETFPNLTHLAINYHMRPPISYDNLLDAIYISLPIFGLAPSLNRPEYVRTEPDRLPLCSAIITSTTTTTDDASSSPNQPALTIPTTDPSHPGTTLHTSYIHNETLFQAHFLGLITTADAHTEHTSVIRTLFADPSYLSAAQMVLRSNTTQIRTSVFGAHPPHEYPRDLLNRGFGNVSYLPGAQHALLQIARRHERPWFEKLQKRRIVEVYVEHLGMGVGEARALLERQLDGMPVGEGIEELMERLLVDGDEEVGQGLVEAFGVAFGFGGQAGQEGESL